MRGVIPSPRKARLMMSLLEQTFSSPPPSASLYCNAFTSPYFPPPFPLSRCRVNFGIFSPLQHVSAFDPSPDERGLNSFPIHARCSKTPKTCETALCFEVTFFPFSFDIRTPAPSLDPQRSWSIFFFFDSEKPLPLDDLSMVSPQIEVSPFCIG